MTEKAAIVGATGPTGHFLARELLRRGRRVRVVSRDRDRLAAAFAGMDVEPHAADALDRESIARAVDGCSTVFDCIGLPADRMADHPVTAHSLAAAMRASGARGVHVSSYWGFLPVRYLPLDEAHPREGGSEPVRLRREAEDVLRAAGAAIVNLPDFFGPRVRVGSLQGALAEAASGRPTQWMGARTTEREYAYVPDAMAAVAELAARDAAYGKHWIVPGGGPISPHGVARIAGRHLGRTVSVRAAGPWLLRLLGLFNKQLRGFLPLMPYYVRPVSYDGGKLRSLLGAVPVTPYDEAIPATLDWLREQAAKPA